MPPTSGVHRSQNPQDQGRRSSGRQVRTSISRPTNYYARPFGSVGGAEEVQDDSPPGFFPAIQHFTDAVAALPKEVMRHFTLMKEVEAKIHGPINEALNITKRIESLPTPLRRTHQPSHQKLLSFTANNSSLANSANASVINGALPGFVPPSVAEAAAQVAQPTQAELQADMQRRQEFYNLRMTIGHILANLDERNVCLAEANRTLGRQLSRMDRVLPHVESEINEEARLGSTTHWAYADNKKKTQQAPERSRRDVAATSHLAAAAAAIHEGDIAAARNEGREKTKKIRAQHADSEFEERAPPKKSHKKKVVDPAEAKATGTTTIAQPQKRRKVEKSGAPAMERTTSTASKTTKAATTAPRATPAVEATKKRAKPPVPPLVKKAAKAGAGSPGQSPRMATASPTMANFAFPGEGSGAQRPTSRMRQGSSTLQHSTLANTASPPTNGDKKTNGEKRGVDTKTGAVQSIEENHDTEMADADGAVPSTDGASNHHKRRAPSESDPRPGTADSVEPDSATMTRTRSNGVRNSENSNHVVHKSSARNGERSHSRAGSNQHILKQIASFNKSPKMGRRELGGSGSNSNDDSSSSEDKPAEVRPKRQGRASRRQSSRGRSPEEEHGREEEAPDVEDEEEERDPDDPDEPKYCYCGRGSYGTMIGCEGSNCKYEWFHLECTGLKEVPDDDVKWYCDDCDPNKNRKNRRHERR